LRKSLPASINPRVSATSHPSANRRTLAIISHPDAGKTTLTEKFLLYGGAIDLAGSVTSRRDRRSTASDWMELEKQRGISISSTVLQFDYAGFRVNLLDTPGHEDFSEDTYRVLTAVDAVIMVVDAGKGVEARTRKLFEICRLRGIPIFTFMNKMDRPSRPPIELIDEIENVLGIASHPMNWPLGDGPRFRGLIERRDDKMHLFERTKAGAFRAPVNCVDIQDPTVREHVDGDLVDKAIEEMELLDIAGAEFDVERVLAGELTPVFFGSAANNFGIQLLLDGFLSMAPRPAGRKSGEEMIEPQDTRFSAFVFKIQANMNPKHRDRMAFIRIVSGKFERDMNVWNESSGKQLRLSNSQRLFAQEREIVDEAWAGDVVGLVGNQPFEIGDTLSSDQSIKFDEIPIFPPECFASIRCRSTATAKRFRAGLDQLVREGVTQLFETASGQTSLLGAVGPLQFEVLKYRLESEYGAEIIMEHQPWTMIRWLLKDGEPLTGTEPPANDVPGGCALARDPVGHWVVLAEAEWAIRMFTRYYEGWELVERLVK
jgi:peptide chain release factor 3